MIDIERVSPNEYTVTLKTNKGVLSVQIGSTIVPVQRTNHEYTATFEVTEKDTEIGIWIKKHTGMSVHYYMLIYRGSNFFDLWKTKDAKLVTSSVIINDVLATENKKLLVPA